MNWLQTIGDTDILREATKSSAVFWYRARRHRLWSAIWIGATLVLLLVIAALAGEWLAREPLAIALAVYGAAWLLYSGWVYFKYLPSRNDRIILNQRHWVTDEVDPLEEQVRALTDEQLRAKTDEFRRRLADGESLGKVRPEAYACVREASRRAREHRQFECQLIGGRVIEGNNVAEMRTGEGKTIVCYMANYMKILQGLRVHMVTVNDYLVKRDAEFCRPVFELLGCTVGYISSDMGTFAEGAEQRRENYGCDITYGTNSEFGFDYLRDNMKMYLRDQVQGKQDFAVVDEVDSILIDEARTPLIISGPAHDDVSNYKVADQVARTLIRKQQQANRDYAQKIDQIEADPRQFGLDPQEAKYKEGVKKFRADPNYLSSDEAEAIGHKQYYVVELDRKSAHMTEHGAKAAQQELGIGTFYDSKNMNWPHYLDNALKAHLCYQREKEYIVRDDQVIIVDEFTGRLMEGRQWSDGLHQAVEAKERVTIKQETQTLATITLQNLFKMYQQLAGMTGTAMTEADEFMKIYELEVVAIPTNRPIRRLDYNDKVYNKLQSKFDAIVEEIRAYSHDGYPSDPFSLYDMLKKARAQMREMQRDGQQTGPELQQRLDAIDEALKAAGGDSYDDEIIRTMQNAYLGLMGEDIGGRPVLIGTVSVESSEKLSQALQRRYGIDHEVLNAKNHAREAEIVAKAGQRHEAQRGKKKMLVGNVTIATNMAGRGTDIVLGPGVPPIGGLHVVGTERHESRRIDNQLRGRCGRQGDPGSSRFFLSFDDDLLRLFMAEWVLKMLNKFAMEDGVPIESRQLSRGIERAQKKVEERNFGIRKNLLEYDEVPDQQRKSFYEMRQRVVEGRELSELIWDMIDESVRDAVNRYLDPRYPAVCVVEWAANELGVQIDETKIDPREFASLQQDVRDQAEAEIRSTVSRTFGEYVDPGVDPDEWDIRGLVNWAEQLGVSLTQKQVRESDPNDLLDKLTEAAIQRIHTADLEPLKVFIDRAFPRQRLVDWARDKFGVSIPLDDLMTATPDEAFSTISEKMRAAYRQREVDYPVQTIVDYAFNNAGNNVNAAYEQLARWANHKFRLDWTYDHFAGKGPQQVYQELRALNEDYLNNGKIEKEIDAALQTHDRNGELVDWARDRFGSVIEYVALEPESPQVREQLVSAAYQMLRFELTQLERMVLLTTFDSVWKDHMYSMDLLRHGIGLRGYAEKDPKIEFKREGTRLFNDTNAAIRERVTDLIFKVRLRLAPPGTDGGGGRPAPSPEAPSDGGPQMQAQHADSTNAGFAAAASATQQQQQAASAPQQQARQPIVRDKPKVGRNDPCPCGSGKKYKHCHGRAGANA